MSGLKSGFFVNKYQKLVSYFKNSNTQYLTFLYIFIFCVPVFLLTFQNCRMDDLIESSLDGSKSAGEVSYDVGQIVEIDPTDESFTEDRLLPANSDITFKIVNVDPVSDSYKWTIKRGFDYVVTDASTNEDTYQTNFSNFGSHDIFAVSYQSTEVKTRASKRLVVGASCSLNDILEIELLSESAASFKVGDSGSATFGLKDSTNYSSIQWKATLPSGQTVTNEEEEEGTEGEEEEKEKEEEDEEDTVTFEIDLSSESAGTLVVQVSAIVISSDDSDSSKNECLTYRKKEFVVGSNVRPYFNPLSFTDGVKNITLENNDIYKYERPDSDRYLQIEVLNADSCEYQINNATQVNFNCNSASIKIPSSTGTSCIGGVVTLLASKNQGATYSQSYYYYCAEDGDYCYFGLSNAKPGHHECAEESLELASTGNDMELDPRVSTTSTTQVSCSSGQYTSLVACDNVNPDNSQCTQENNGCYTWACNSGYHRLGNSCEGCPTSNACNANNPSNSTCQADGNGCYTWSCNTGYHRFGNSCESCLTSNACNANNPSNSTCQADSNGCYTWSCNTGYHRLGNSCESCPTSNACNTNNPSNSTCQADSNGCYTWSCNTGYHRLGNSCESCPTSNACNTNNPSNSTCQADSNSCYTWSCNANYRRSSNTCVSCPTSTACDANNPSNSTCQADGNGCYTWSCDTGYHISGNACVSCPTSTTCNANNPSNSTCQADGNSCYTWSCDTNYRRSSNTCVSCPTSTACDANNPSNSTCQADGNGCYSWSCDTNYRRSGNRCVSCSTSSSCNANNPSNSTCQADGNGCYSWSCNTNYRRSGNRCVSCSTSSSCNANNPSNSTCQADGNGCYSWSCDTNYRRSGNRCVSCSTSSSCNANNPSNSTCRADSNGCYSWSCDTNYRRSGNRCVSCSTSSSCNANNPSNSTCRADSNGCYSWSCNDDYRRSGNTCVSCPTSNTCNANNPSNSTCRADSNGCYSWSCDNGYKRNGDSCDEEIIKPAIDGVCNHTRPYNQSNLCTKGTQSAINTGVWPWTWTCGGINNGSDAQCKFNCPNSYPFENHCNSPANASCVLISSGDAKGCYTWSCNSGYRRSGNSCVTCTTASSCNSSKPENSTCSADANGCYEWSCNDGYTKSGNSCVEPTEPTPDCGTGSMDCADGESGSGCCSVGHFNESPGDSQNLIRWTCRQTSSSTVGQVTCNTTPDTGFELCSNGFKAKRMAYWLQDQPKSDCDTIAAGGGHVQWRGDRCNYAVGTPSGHTHVFEANRCGGPWIKTNEYHYMDTLSDSRGDIIKHVICDCK